MAKSPANHVLNDIGEFVVFVCSLNVAGEGIAKVDLHLGKSLIYLLKEVIIQQLANFFQAITLLYWPKLEGLFKITVLKFDR